MRHDTLSTVRIIGVAFSLQAEAISFVPKSHARQIRFDAVQTERGMCNALPLTLNRTSRAADVASLGTELALFLIGQLAPSASVTTFEQYNEPKLIPALISIFDAVEMALKFIGHLL